jgi:hypothetical protein
MPFKGYKIVLTLFHMDMVIKIFENKRNKRILLILATEIQLQRSETIKIRVGRIIKNFQSEREFSDFLLLLDAVEVAHLEHINSNNIILGNQIISRPVFLTLAQKMVDEYGLSHDADMIFKCSALKIENILKKIKEKITVYFSRKYGIYCNPDNKENRYPVAGGRKRLIWKLKEKDIDHTPTNIKEEGTTARNLSRDIIEINTLFRKILKLDYDLIKHYSEDYYLNLDDYEIKIVED